MSVHIETISAQYARVEAFDAGEVVPNFGDTDEPLSQPALIIGDGDNTLVVMGERGELMALIDRARKMVLSLP